MFRFSKLTSLLIFVTAELFFVSNVHALTKGGCTGAGGEVIESGIDGWWFCCSGTVLECHSCTGEINSANASKNCDAAITNPVGNSPNIIKSPTATILIKLPTKEQNVAIPQKVWERLDNSCQQKLLDNPSALNQCKVATPKKLIRQ
jgi:hypothetical protein